MGKLQRMPFKFRKAVFLRLEDIVDIVSLSKEDRIKYDESIKVYRYNLVAEAYARSSRTASIAGSFLSEWREMCQIADNFSKVGKDSVIFYVYSFGVMKKVSIFAASFVPHRHEK